MGKRVSFSCIYIRHLYGKKLSFFFFSYSLAQHDAETHGQFNEVVQQFTEKLGWIIGLTPTAK